MNLEEFLEEMDSYIENENKHLFKNTDNTSHLYSNKNSIAQYMTKIDDEKYNKMGYYPKTYSEKKTDEFIFDDDCYDSPYTDYRTNSYTGARNNYTNSYNKYNYYKEVVEKSWIINLDTREPKLIINDIDDGIIPEIIAGYDWVIELELDHQQIREIKNLPKNLKELSLYGNNIVNIPYDSLPEGLEEINLSRNKIIILENIPKSVKKLDVSHNHIKKCFIEDNNLDEISIESNYLTEFPKFPIDLKKLDISSNNLKEINFMEDSIEELDVSFNQLIQIRKLSKNLKFLNGFNNNIKMIYSYPPNIEHIDLSYNEIMWVPVLPISVKNADFSSNKINAISIVDSNGKIDYKNGLLVGPGTIKLYNNPLDNVPNHILADSRIKHHKIIKPVIPQYFEIKLIKTINL